MRFIREIRPGVSAGIDIPEPVSQETTEKLKLAGYREATESEVAAHPNVTSLTGPARANKKESV